MRDSASLSANIAILAIFYTFLGSLVSFVFYYIFDEFNEEWEKKSNVFQVYDVAIEIALIALVSFWATFMINTAAPIFPVPTSLSSFVDSYTTGMFFMYTVFLFMNDLSSKLTHIYNENLGKHFDRLFPSEGSILNLSLSYKTN
jgi:hypothetical protein